MTTTATGPVSIKGTTASLSVFKSTDDLDYFMNTSSRKDLNTKFLTMIKEFRGEDANGNGKSATLSNKTQRGFSLSQILAQSLQNGDKQMLEAALCVSSAQHSKVLQVSLMRLPAAMVLPLLEAITTRLTLKPRRAMHLMPWLKNLLLCHAGYLSTIPAANKMLAPLQQSIEERMSAMNSMQKLAGRLELLLKQAELRALSVSEAGKEVSEEPLAVYDESESEPETENDLSDAEMSEADEDEDDEEDFDSENDGNMEDNEEEDFEEEDDDDSFEDEDDEDEEDFE